jgi:hypothetical protein
MATNTTLLDAELLAAHDRLLAAWERDDDETAAAYEQVRDLPARTLAGAAVKLQTALLTRGVDDDDDGRAMRDALRAIADHAEAERRRIGDDLARIDAARENVDAIVAQFGGQAVQ